MINLQDFITSHNVAYVGDIHAIDFTQFANKTQDIMTEYKAISGANIVTKGLSADLSDGIAISKVVFTVTLAQGTNKVKNNMKNITVIFAEDLKDEKAKLQNFISSYDIAENKIADDSGEDVAIINLRIQKETLLKNIKQL